ncbi:MAG: glucose 1-dehydrogenase [Taibaiella sp.]|jgi:NAD(P)-dependent dehydrogenase (short-subunit alcohol dehydrogenase family)
MRTSEQSQFPAPGANLSESVVLVTGALTGIGRATAIAFAKEGAKVVVSGRKEAEGKSLAEELNALGAEAAFVRADVRFEADVEQLVAQTISRFGRLDIAVNNAGTEGTPGPVTEQTVETYTNIFDTNVLGVLLSMKHQLKVMQKQGSGSIVNVSSVLGRKGMPNVSVYTASKHAVEGLTKAAALEVANTGIRVNVVAPGPIETPMLNRFVTTDEQKEGFKSIVPVQRMGLPEEIAQTIVFLGSSKSPFLTGQSIAVDGGMLA